VSTQAGFIDFLHGIDVRPLLPRITCPTLVVTTGDPHNAAQNITGLEQTRAWQSTIPHSELCIIPNDSFHVAASAPDESCRVTLDFVDRQEQRHRGA
jgi:3-oxoadipate enol-lactonase